MARRLQFKRDLITLQKMPDEPLVKYVARAKGLRNELVIAGYNITKEEVAASIKAGLPSRFDVLATILETSQDTIDLDTLLARFTVEQRTSSTPPNDVTYAANHNLRLQPTASQPSARTNLPRYNSRPTGASRHPITDQRQCYYCGRKGHLQRECHKRQRDAESIPVNTQEHHAGQQRPHVAFAATALVHNEPWIFDSGASQRICCNFKDMRNIQPLEVEVFIAFGNAQQAKAAGLGCAEPTKAAASTFPSLRSCRFLQQPPTCCPFPEQSTWECFFNVSGRECTISKDTQLLATANSSNGLCHRAVLLHHQHQQASQWMQSFGIGDLGISPTAAWPECSAIKWVWKFSRRPQTSNRRELPSALLV